MLTTGFRFRADTRYTLLKMRTIILVLFLLALTPVLIAQQPSAAAKKESELRSLLEKSRTAKDDSLRLALNNVFFEELLSLLQPGNTYALSFDSLNIGKIEAPDKSFRMFNWNIQQNNGKNIYYLIIKHSQSGQAIALNPVEAREELSDTEIFRNGEWPGGLYYKIIQRKEAGLRGYTLLSWDGFSRRTSRKCIEFLEFDSEGIPVFGSPKFKTKQGIRNRVNSEYSSEASFTQSYDRQKITLVNVRKSQRKVDDEVIVLDRLVPLNESLEGQRWAYVPAGNIYDAYVIFRNQWTFVEDIVPRNPAVPGKPSTGRKRPEQGLIPSGKSKERR